MEELALEGGNTVAQIVAFGGRGLQEPYRGGQTGLGGVGVLAPERFDDRLGVTASVRGADRQGRPLAELEQAVAAEQVQKPGALLSLSAAHDEHAPAGTTDATVGLDQQASAGAVDELQAPEVHDDQAAGP